MSRVKQCFSNPLVSHSFCRKTDRQTDSKKNTSVCQTQTLFTRTFNVKVNVKFASTLTLSHYINVDVKAYSHSVRKNCFSVNILIDILLKKVVVVLHVNIHRQQFTLLLPSIAIAVSVAPRERVFNAMSGYGTNQFTR